LIDLIDGFSAIVEVYRGARWLVPQYFSDVVVTPSKLGLAYFSSSTPVAYTLPHLSYLPATTF
jgi:hypothetical protein